MKGLCVGCNRTRELAEVHGQQIGYQGRLVTVGLCSECAEREELAASYWPDESELGWEEGDDD